MQMEWRHLSLLCRGSSNPIPLSPPSDSKRWGWSTIFLLTHKGELYTGRISAMAFGSEFGPFYLSHLRAWLMIAVLESWRCGTRMTVSEMPVSAFLTSHGPLLYFIGTGKSHYSRMILLPLSLLDIPHNAAGVIFFFILVMWAQFFFMLYLYHFCSGKCCKPNSGTL